MTIKNKINFHWFRRDLRLEDNAALFHALTSKNPVIPVFIFDSSILEKLEDKEDKRVAFIHQTIANLQNQLQKIGSSLLVKYGKPIEVWKQLIKEFNIDTVFTNHDYEPYAINRDLSIKEFLSANHINFLTFKDQVIFEKDEVIKDDGKPYTIYTPYSKKWMSKLSEDALASYSCEKHYSNFLKFDNHEVILLATMGFKETQTIYPTSTLDSKILLEYGAKRDIPSINGTSRLGLHLRFGTISIRKVARDSKDISFKWLNELIWREFYMMIIWHFPHVVNSAFKPAYNTIKWRNDVQEFKMWCEGKTGYPIVDAGMRELNNTGFMHNRVRMIVASFLTKHLLIDWRWGESYFANKLLDFELSSNNGGWQWAAGTGCDAAPYFRIFNPYEQTKKFDPDFKYIRKWVPEFEDFSYPKPIVDHKFARERCLNTYKIGIVKSV